MNQSVTIQGEKKIFEPVHKLTGKKVTATQKIKMKLLHRRVKNFFAL
jgi:hypothetical protein